MRPSRKAKKFSEHDIGIHIVDTNFYFIVKMAIYVKV